MGLLLARGGMGRRGRAGEREGALKEGGSERKKRTERLFVFGHVWRWGCLGGLSDVDGRLFERFVVDGSGCPGGWQCAATTYIQSLDGERMLYSGVGDRHGRRGRCTPRLCFFAGSFGMGLELFRFRASNYAIEESISDYKVGKEFCHLNRLPEYVGAVDVRG